MGKYSKPPQSELATALANGYCNLRFQEGKPVLDREFNLAVDLVNPRRLAASYLGNGVLAGSDGFKIAAVTPATNDFQISAGSCLVDGIQVTLAANTTYRTQPLKTNVAALPAGASNVYLHVTTREVIGSEDPALLNPDDVKFETTVREKVEWEVLVSSAAITTPDHFLLAVIDTGAATALDRRRMNLQLSTVRDELDTARRSAVSLAARLDTSLEETGKLRANAVSGAQIAQGAVALPQIKSLAFNGTLTIPPATESSLTFFKGKRQAMILTSVMVTSGTGSVTWRELVEVSVLAGITTSSRGVRVKNENLAGGDTLTVSIQAIEIAQS
jgi:hypothetical protein